MREEPKNEWMFRFAQNDSTIKIVKPLLLFVIRL